MDDLSGRAGRLRRGDGLTIGAEQRAPGTDFRRFGAHVADQVRQLLAAGVPVERTAAVGFSKGGAIAIIASALLRDPRIAQHAPPAAMITVDGGIRDDFVR